MKGSHIVLNIPNRLDRKEYSGNKEVTLNNSTISFDKTKDIMLKKEGKLNLYKSKFGRTTQQIGKITWSGKQRKDNKLIFSNPRTQNQDLNLTEQPQDFHSRNWK